PLLTRSMAMERRDFLKYTGIGMGALLLPLHGRFVSAAELAGGKLDVKFKKKLADAALQAAKEGGGSYCDVPVGRYLRSCVITREDTVQSVVTTESTAVGIRVIAHGTWGFAATSSLDTDSVAKA